MRSAVSRNYGFDYNLNNKATGNTKRITKSVGISLELSMGANHKGRNLSTAQDDDHNDTDDKRMTDLTARSKSSASAADAPSGYLDTITEGDPVTDGGETVESDDPNDTDLSDLFVDVTGTETLVETQDGEKQNRSVATGEEESLAGDVMDVTRQDGLEDTLPKPESGEEG